MALLTPPLVDSEKSGMPRREQPSWVYGVIWRIDTPWSGSHWLSPGSVGPFLQTSARCVCSRSTPGQTSPSHCQVWGSGWWPVLDGLWTVLGLLGRNGRTSVGFGTPPASSRPIAWYWWAIIVSFRPGRKGRAVGRSEAQGFEDPI